jgi:hypothetical protein
VPLLTGLTQSHFDALVETALVTCRRSLFDVTLTRCPVDQAERAVENALEITRLLSRKRPPHGTNLVAQSGPRKTIKCSAPLGLSDSLQRLNTICHLLLCILLIEFDLSEYHKAVAAV